jgi:hypothetical protein
MLTILKIIVFILIVILIIFAISSWVFDIFPDATNTTLWIVSALGLLLALIGLLTSISRHSKIKLGNVNRAELYGVSIAIAAWLFQMNLRIDSLYQTLINLQPR